jgi:hypothetical protein
MMNGYGNFHNSDLGRTCSNSMLETHMALLNNLIATATDFNLRGTVNDMRNGRGRGGSMVMGVIRYNLIIRTPAAGSIA